MVEFCFGFGYSVANDATLILHRATPAPHSRKLPNPTVIAHDFPARAALSARRLATFTLVPARHPGLHWEALVAHRRKRRAVPVPAPHANRRAAHCAHAVGLFFLAQAARLQLHGARRLGRLCVGEAWHCG